MYRKDRYPPNWRELAVACKVRAHWRCEVCQVLHGDERVSKRTGQVYRVWLHAAHAKLNDTANLQPELQALCPSCHGALDWKLRRREERIVLEQLKHQMVLHRVPLRVVV
jgi:hypothetical protein